MTEVRRSQFPGVCIITLVKDCTPELRATLASVQIQSEPVTQFVILDGSTRSNPAVVQELAISNGAEYYWEKPAGIFQAMNSALYGVGGNPYVLFLNSGDTLASSNVLELLRQEVSKLSSIPSWLVGRIEAARQKDVWIYKNHETLGDPIMMARLGLIWFPHPASFSRKSFLAAEGSFDTRFPVAADYLLSLRMLLKDRPVFLGEVIARHTLDGNSDRRFMRGRAEECASRVIVFGPSQIALELLVGPLVTFIRICRRSWQKIVYATSNGTPGNPSRKWRPTGS